MNLNTLKVLTLALMLQLFSACGSDNDSGGSAALELEGGWGFSCLEISSNNSTENQTRNFDFSASTFVEQLQVYGGDDATCATIKESRKISGTYTEGTKNDANITPIDLVLTAVTMTVNDDNTLSYLNAEASSGNSTAICGGNWSKGVSKTLTTKNCAGNALNLPYAGLKLFDIYKISESNLLFGQRDAGLPTSAANRPTSIDEALSFARK